MQEDNSVTVNELNEFITALHLGVAKVRHKKTLWQLLAAHQRELNRQQTGDPGSAEYLHDLSIYKAVALLAVTWILNRLEVKVRAGKRGSRDTWQASRYLLAAIDTFQAGADELAKHLPRPKIFVGSAGRLQHLFDLTPDRADYVAEAAHNLIRCTKNRSA